VILKLSGEGLIRMKNKPDRGVVAILAVIFMTSCFALVSLIEQMQSSTSDRDTAGVSQNNGSTPVKQRSESPSPFLSWVGKTFVFLPAEDTDYSQFSVVKKRGIRISRYEDRFGLKYSKFVGVSLICLRVEKERLLFRVPKYHINVVCSLVTYTDGNRDPNLLSNIDMIGPAEETDKTVQQLIPATEEVSSAVLALKQADGDKYEASDYQLIMDLLRQQTGATDDEISRVILVGLQDLQQRGVHDETCMSLMHHTSDSIPEGATVRLPEVVAAYITLRTHG
jgi:hypothetical protein